MMNKQTDFESSEYAVQIIAKGFYDDAGCGNGKVYRVESTIVRLNSGALNEWIMSQNHNWRDCYEDGPQGDAEWEAHKAEKRERSAAWEARIKNELGLTGCSGSVAVTQSFAEVFTVVRVWELKD